MASGSGAGLRTQKHQHHSDGEYHSAPKRTHQAGRRRNSGRGLPNPPRTPCPAGRPRQTLCRGQVLRRRRTFQQCRQHRLSQFFRTMRTLYPVAGDQAHGVSQRRQRQPRKRCIRSSRPPFHLVPNLGGTGSRDGKFSGRTGAGRTARSRTAPPALGSLPAAVRGGFLW
ncbi:hypothetical protein SDC9_172612 [bioreactor metagenome]|uniref:Uncharacterized protein n=1 Tax=bioreactor metagenome TaxID=1076179 RepID=A0A645GET8_9ZZZZ